MKLESFIHRDYYYVEIEKKFDTYDPVQHRLQCDIDFVLYDVVVVSNGRVELNVHGHRYLEKGVIKQLMQDKNDIGFDDTKSPAAIFEEWAAKEPERLLRKVSFKTVSNNTVSVYVFNRRPQLSEKMDGLVSSLLKEYVALLTERTYYVKLNIPDFGDEFKEISNFRYYGCNDDGTLKDHDEMIEEITAKVEEILDKRYRW